MFAKIVRLILVFVLVRGLLHGRTRTTKKDTSHEPRLASQGPAKESSVDRSGEEEPNRGDYQVTSESQPVANDDIAGGQDSPVNQATSNYDESTEPTCAIDSDLSHYDLIENGLASPSTDSSEKLPSESPEETLLESDSPPTQLDEGESTHPPSNATSGVSSHSDSIAVPLKLRKSSKLSEVNPLDEPSKSQEGKKKKTKPKIPYNTGGKRNRRKDSSSLVNDAGEKSRLTPRPDLICRKSSVSWQWDIVLAVEEECNIKEVLYNGEPLTIMDGEYRLPSLRGHLSIEYGDREPEEFPLFVDTPLIFKLRVDWNGEGRKIGGITRGHFIVMVPREWKRTGSAPVEPQECTDTNFMAHFFYVKKGDSDGDIDGFEDYGFALTKTGFELRGAIVFDNSDDGELFVGTPPELRPASSVVWARVGEEKAGGWKGENFKPTEQSLAEVLNDRQGRFFVRVYDDGAKLLDSGEFRYLRDLREIRMNGEPYTETSLLVPPAVGHSDTKLQFVGADGDKIHPRLETHATHATVQPEGTVIVKPHPDMDHISCVLESSVNTVIRPPRIWWRMGRDEEAPNNWRDMALTMTRQQFREHANAGKAMQLRLPTHIASVKVGFDDELDRKYCPSKRGEDSEIPLADFVDYSQIDQRLNKNVSFNVQCGEEVMALILISADPVPAIVSFTSEPAVVHVGGTATLRWSTKHAEANSVVIEPEIGSVESSGSVSITPNETSTFTLRLTVPGMGDVTEVATVKVQAEHDAKTAPQVRSARGSLRRGKGFSRSELHAAGLTDEDILCRSIRFDRRRRSTHDANIDRIRRAIDD